MTDYKELIETLRTHAEYCDMPFSWMNEAYVEAADAIEQLQKERDAAVADISMLIVQKDPCKICIQGFGEDPCRCLECDEVTPYGNFEWRGAQDG